MKLPKDLPFAIIPGIPNDGPFVKMPEEFIEAVVRDCAKMAREGGAHISGHDPRIIEQAILRRYGLSPPPPKPEDDRHA